MLIQPLLKNHPSLTVLNSAKRQTEDLVTLITVTMIDQKANVTIEGMALEVAHRDNNFWDHIYIDSGLLDLNRTQLDLDDDYAQLLVPFWPQIKQHLIQAHHFFSGIKVIAWDMAITQHGTVIIEGNRGWGIINVQNLIAKPLLTGRFLEMYLNTSISDTDLNS